jgi:NH3-dependent NAD+ synthetase
MKKVIFAIAILLGLSASVIAQTPSTKLKSDKEKTEMKMKMKMKDGVMMVDNKMMLCKEGKCTALKEDYKFSDGSKVSPKGVLTLPDGKTKKMMNGFEADKNGKIAMIAHGEMGHVCGPKCPMNKKM